MISKALLFDLAAENAVDHECMHAKGDASAELLRIALAKNANLVVVGKSIQRSPPSRRFARPTTHRRAQGAGRRRPVTSDACRTHMGT
jgi:hypothetical protein